MANSTPLKSKRNRYEGSASQALGSMTGAIALLVLALFFALPPPGMTQAGPNASARYTPGAAQALVLYKQALNCFAMKNFSGCVENCKASLKLDSHNKNAPHLCALAYSELGDQYNANLQFRAALSLDYNFIECHNNYGIFLDKKGDLEEAKKQFQECIRLAPNYPNAYYNLGTILQKQADLDGACANYRMAIRINPNYWEAHKDLGLCLFQKFERGDSGEIAESVEKLQTAAKLVPNNPMVHYHLGYISCCNLAISMRAKQSLEGP